MLFIKRWTEKFTWDTGHMDGISMFSFIKMTLCAINNEKSFPLQTVNQSYFTVSKRNYLTKKLRTWLFVYNVLVCRN